MSTRSIQDCTHFTSKCQYVTTASVMPKKTKKQKILAELHKKFARSSEGQISVKSQNQPSVISTQYSIPTTFTYKQHAFLKPQIYKNSSDYSYITRDLIRITIFSLVTFIFQGMLYFLLRTR